MTFDRVSCVSQALYGIKNYFAIYLIDKKST